MADGLFTWEGDRESEACVGFRGRGVVWVLDQR